MSVNELSLARRYHTLAKEYSHRPVVARRNTIPSLLKLLRSSDREVRLLAAETILFLAEHPENPEFLCHEKDFLACIYNEYQQSEATDAEIHGVVGNVFDHLRVCLEKEGEGASRGATADGESCRIAKGRSTRVARGVGQCRYVTVEIANASSHNLPQLEDSLHTIRGIVSYTMDIPTKRFTLYTSTPSGTIAKVLTDAGFTTVVISDMEAVVDEQENVGGFRKHSFAQGAAPGYLNSAFRGGASIYQHTLVLHGMDSNTLASRIQQQKEEEMRKKNRAEKSQLNKFMSKLTAGWW